MGFIRFGSMFIPPLGKFYQHIPPVTHMFAGVIFHILDHLPGVRNPFREHQESGPDLVQFSVYALTSLEACCRPIHSFVHHFLPCSPHSFERLFVLSSLVGWLIDLRLLVSSSVHSFANSFDLSFIFLPYRSYAEIDYLMVGIRSIYFIPFQINSTAFPLKRGEVDT